MTPRSLGIAALVLAGLAVLSILFVDLPLAHWVAARPGSVHEVFRTGTRWLDLASLRSLADSALALVLIGAALVAWSRPAWRPVGKLLLLVALTNLGAHFAVGLLKPQFGRLRPYQIAESDWIDRFFAGGNSFPSGHTAFWWSLWFPLAWGLPRWRSVLALPAVFIALARVLVNDHFASDVLASMALSAALAALLIVIFARSARLSPRREPEPSSPP